MTRSDKRENLVHRSAGEILSVLPVGIRQGYVRDAERVARLIISMAENPEFNPRSTAGPHRSPLPQRGRPDSEEA